MREDSPGRVDAGIQREAHLTPDMMARDSGLLPLDGRQAGGC